MKQIGYDTLVQRIPESYLKATFAKYLASQYFYDKGTESNVCEFYEYVNSFDHWAAGPQDVDPHETGSYAEELSRNFKGYLFTSPAENTNTNTSHSSLLDEVIARSHIEPKSKEAYKGEL